MNEITKIHLGRQAYTISVDAYKLLQDYLHAIKRQVGGNGKDVVDEVELRMAELLTERGVTAEKVILGEDIAYLKQQLGEPGDFADEADEKSDETDASTTSRRLFRDTENGMLAGVSAGIAKYFSIDPVWIRLAFIGLVFAGGSGVLLYIILWLILPEAKTPSERLQMQGKPVTVDSIKEIVDRADVEGVARRAGDTVGKAVHSVLKVVLAVVGIVLMTAATAALLALISGSSYVALNPDTITAGHIFPVGASEVALVGLGVLVAALIIVFFLIAGLSMYKRRWVLPGWGLGAMVAVLLASVAIGVALAADAVPKVRSRYEASQHTVNVPVAQFNKLHVVGDTRASVTYKQAASTSVQVKFRGDVDFSKMITEVKDQTLTVDSQAFTQNIECKTLCLFHDSYIEVVIFGPQLQEVSVEGHGYGLTINEMSNQTLKIHAPDNSVFISKVVADKVHIEKTTDGIWNLALSGTYSGGPSNSQHISLYYGQTATVSAKDVDIQLHEECMLETSDVVYVGDNFKTFTINGKQFASGNELLAQQNYTQPNVYNCVGAIPGFSESTVIRETNGEVEVLHSQ